MALVVVDFLAANFERVPDTRVLQIHSVTGLLHINGGHVLVVSLALHLNERLFGHTFIDAWGEVKIRLNSAHAEHRSGSSWREHLGPGWL